MSALIGSMALTLVMALAAPIIPETVDVDGMGQVDLKSFTCSDTPRSTVIQRVCYARPQRIMIASVRGNYRVACGLPPNIYNAFITADSMGRFYGRSISANVTFQCRSSR